MQYWQYLIRSDCPTQFPGCRQGRHQQRQSALVWRCRRQSQSLSLPQREGPRAQQEERAEAEGPRQQAHELLETNAPDDEIAALILHKDQERDGNLGALFRARPEHERNPAPNDKEEAKLITIEIKNLIKKNNKKYI